MGSNDFRNIVSETDMRQICIIIVSYLYYFMMILARISYRCKSYPLLMVDVRRFGGP